jgi:ATP-dependent Clp protease ATP-binding subunit ClpB
MEAMREHFRPEFLNRIDEIVIFEPLGREQITEIVDIQLQRVSDRLADRSIELRTTPGAREWLASRGYDPVYGARPLKRLIQREVLDTLAMKLLNGELHDGEVVTIDSTDHGLSFQAELTEAPLVA